MVYSQTLLMKGQNLFSKHFGFSLTLEEIQEILDGLVRYIVTLGSGENSDAGGDRRVRDLQQS